MSRGIGDPELAEGLPGGGDVARGPIRLVLNIELAELGSDDPTGAKVIEAVDQGVRGIEIALGQHVRPCGRGVGG